MQESHCLGTKLRGIELLKNLLQAIHQGFGKIDIGSHIAGLSLACSYTEVVNDPSAMPLIQIMLLSLEKQRLSIVGVGNLFSVYIVQPTGQEVVFGQNWTTNTRVIIDSHTPGKFITGRGIMPEMYSVEVPVKLGDLIIATTAGRLINRAKLDELMKTAGCDPETANRHLMTILEPKDVGYTEHGLAWAITCVEE